MKNCSTKNSRKGAQWIGLCYHFAAPGSSPKNIIYAFIINSQVCTISALRKEQK